MSIGTLRRAVETLVNDGILLRREGAGTFVRTYRDQGYWNAFQIFRNLDGQKRGSRGRLVTFEVTSDVDEKILSALHLSKGQEVIHIVRHWISIKTGTEEIVSIDESFLVKEKFSKFTLDYFLTHFRTGESFYEHFEALCTERLSLTFGYEPVEYRINRGRVDVTKVFFDLS